MKKKKNELKEKLKNDEKILEQEYYTKLIDQKNIKEEQENDLLLKFKNQYLVLKEKTIVQALALSKHNPDIDQFVEKVKLLTEDAFVTSQIIQKDLIVDNENDILTNTTLLKINQKEIQKSFRARTTQIRGKRPRVNSSSYLLSRSHRPRFSYE